MVTLKKGPVQKGEAKAKIEAVSIRLFAEKGYAETSIKDIAQAAGVSDGALYRHYTSKDALVRNLFANNYLSFVDTLENIHKDEATMEAKVAAMVRGFCALFDEDRHLFAFLLLSQSDGIRAITEGTKTPMDAVAEVVALGVAPQAVPLKTAALVGIVLQTASFYLHDKIPGRMSPSADLITANCLGALRA